jgi:Fe-S-cluster containining protein
VSAESSKTFPHLEHLSLCVSTSPGQVAPKSSCKGQEALIRESAVLDSHDKLARKISVLMRMEHVEPGAEAAALRALFHASVSHILRFMVLPARDSELIQIMDASLADAARRAGPWLVCRPGCTQCCYGAFAINQLDVLRLRAGLDELRVSDPERAHVIEERAHQWIAEFGADFPGNLYTGILSESDEDRARFDDFANDAACPALDPATGLCDLYAHRPMACRVFGPPVRVDAEGDSAHALGHCELCFIGATPEQVAACEMPVPHGLEQSMIDELARSGLHGETVVAFALLS